MYVLVVIRYSQPMEAVAAVTPAHRAYLASLKEQGVLLASGPFDPRTGGALLLRLPEGDTGAINRIRDGDPFWQKSIASYEMFRWAPTLGLAELDRL